MNATKLYVAFSGGGLAVYNWQSGSFLQYIGSNISPVNILVDTSGTINKLYLSENMLNRVTLMYENGTIIKQISTPPSPWGILEYQDKIYVTNSQNSNITA